MAEPYVGEIRLFGFRVLPQYWAYCDGASLPVSNYQALYSLIQNYYGGDNKNFNLPDLRGRVPLHMGQSMSTGQMYNVGNKGGVETVVLTAAQTPPHTHSAYGTTLNGDAWKPSNVTLLATSTDTTDPIYGNPPNLVPMNGGVISGTGAISPAGHNNVQPSMVVYFAIALMGLYPPRSS